MKKVLSFLLSAIMIVTALVSCAPAADQLDPAITVASSDAAEYAEWLDGRLDTIPDEVIIGIGSNEKYGVDMSDFDEDGYIARAMNGDVLLFGATEDGLDRAVREYAQAVDVGASSTIDTVYGEGPRIEKLTIAGTDISEFTVVAEREEKRAATGRGPTFDNARVAAEDFVRLTAIATGVTLPIVDKGAESGEHFIRFEFLPEAEIGSEQSFTYEVKDGDLIIKGEPRTAGCSNAVYHFFEYELGWDGLSFGDSYLAEADEIHILEGVSAAVDPMFDYFYPNIYSMSENGYQNDKSFIYLGKITNACHGIQGQYGFDESLTFPDSGICYTGEDIYNTYYDSFKAVVESKTAAGAKIGYDYLYQDISHPDGDHYCLCNTCKTVYRKEGNAYSGLSVYFGNKVAAQMEEEDFGGLKWLIFAYSGSNKPCKTAPRDDVWVTLCTDGACVNHPLTGEGCTGDTLLAQQVANNYGKENSVYAITDRTNNGHFAEWIRGWCDLTDSLYVWHYALPATTYSYTMFDFMYEEWTFLHECGVKGIVWEAEYDGLGLGRLRFQLVSWLQWHPDATEEEYNAARDEIMRREYGDGADLVLDMIGLWRETESTVGCFHCWTFTEHFRLGTYDTEIYAKNANKMYELLDIARDKASCYQQDKNVALLQMEVAYRQCMCTYFNAVAASNEELIGFLNTRYEQFKYLAAYCGLDIKAIGLDSYMGQAVLSDTLEEAAANEWAPYKEELTTYSVPYDYEHVVIIGVDGAGHAWQDAYTPCMDEIFAEGTTTQRCRISSPTVSAPNWGTTLTGVVPQLHGMENGDSDPYTNEKYPTYFRLAREADPDATLACVTSWGSMPTAMIEPGLGVISRTGSDAEVMRQAVEMVETEQPDLMFVYFGNVDHVGHDHGNKSDAYLNALYMVDNYIGQIYDTLVEEGIADETLFLVTADHGHTARGGHGGQTDDEVNVFFGAAGPGLIPNDDVEMYLLDIPAIITHALGAEGNDGVWDSYIPAGFFRDCPEGETRPDLVTTGKKVGETPTGEGALENYVDTSKLKTAIFFDGDLDDSFGDTEIVSEGELSYADGYYGKAASMTKKSVLYSEDITFDTDSFSIGMWVKSDIKYMTSNLLYANKDHRSSSDSGFSFNFVGDTEFTAGDGKNGDLLFYGCPDGYHKSKWYHTLLVVDRDAGTVSVYYNFKLCCTCELSDTLDGVSFDSGAPFVLGNDTTGDDPTTGLFDDLLIFNGALSAEEISSLSEYYFK